MSRRTNGKKFRNSDLSNIYSYLDRNANRELPETNLKEAGSFIKLKTQTGFELAIVLKYISRNELKSYLREHNYPNDSEIWNKNYAILGHYRKEDIDQIVGSGDFDRHPQLHLLIVKVNSKSDYSLQAGESEDTSKLFRYLKELGESDPKVNDYIRTLLNMTVMNLATSDMSRAYSENQKGADDFKNHDSINKENDREIDSEST